jgi:hypothetical protein
MTRQSASRHRPRPASGWAALQHQPSGPLLRCRCGAAWTDDDGGRHAHQAVFGHQPRQSEPEPAEGHQP